MKALLCTKFGLPEDLVVREIAVPVAAENEVIIEVMACSVNFPDLLMIQDKYQFKPDLPFSPGGEVSGLVTQIGSGVHGLEVGQKVIALCGWGGFAEKLKVNASRVFPIPEEMDFISAASSLYTLATAYHGLKDRGNLKAGETVLVLGAAGGIGMATIALAKLFGAQVVAAASSEEKIEACLQMGADFAINYEREDFKTRLLDLTNQKGVDVILDPVGGKYAETAVRCLAWKGRYLVLGFANGDIPKIPLNIPLLKGASIIGVFWGRFSREEPEMHLNNLKDLVKWLAEGKLKVHIHQIYSLEEASTALTDLKNRKVIGKAVVKIK
jgi:NADPH2:quinone reductase